MLPLFRFEMFIPFFFWLPAVVSLAALVGLWFLRDLTMKAGIVLGAWFTAAFMLESLAPQMTLIWAGGIAFTA